jgi:hypothetical protein
VQAPCRDWAIHCDAKAGTHQWDAMRRRIQSGGAAARAANDVPRADAAPAAAPGAAQAAPMMQIPSRANETANRPPVITKMPDPATLPCVSLLGVVKVPVALRPGHTAATLDAKLGRGARFGVRTSSHDAMCKYVTERMGDTGAHFGLMNLLNTDGDRYSSNSTPKYLDVLPMMRPGEPEPRERVSVRVLVVDSASASASRRPRDIAVDVAVGATVGTLVEAIRETCDVSPFETVLLATAVFKPQAALSNDGSYHSAECKISHVYTSRDKSFMSKPARGVKGFARAFPPEIRVRFQAQQPRVGRGSRRAGQKRLPRRARGVRVAERREASRGRGPGVPLRFQGVRGGREEAGSG